MLSFLPVRNLRFKLPLTEHIKVDTAIQRSLGPTKLLYCSVQNWKVGETTIVGPPEFRQLLVANCWRSNGSIGHGREGERSSFCIENYVNLNAITAQPNYFESGRATREDLLRCSIEWNLNAAGSSVIDIRKAGKKYLDGLNAT